MEIKNCELADVHEILLLYQAARDLQTLRKMVVWPVFDQAFIEKEINEDRQWKLVSEKVIACNWAITFNDWDDSIYIHRICVNPGLYGNRYIDILVGWAKQYALKLGKRFVRLDTLGNNIKLIEHYTSAGFEFLGIFRLTDTTNLPGHYHQEPNCCLF